MLKREMVREIKDLHSIIKCKCIDCCGNVVKEARLCPADDCPLHATKQAIFHRKA